jgi:outer membrane protein OmpA-like peptidoglycan-associated protein
MFQEVVLGCNPGEGRSGMKFCANCGTQLHEGENFCARCGTAVQAETAAAGKTKPNPVASSSLAPMTTLLAHTTQGFSDVAPQPEAALQKLATLRTQNPAPANNSGKKILIVILAVVLLGGVTVVGGAVYLGYQAKQKVTSALNKIDGKSDNPTEDRHKAVSDDSPRGNDNSSRDEDKSDPLSTLLGKLQGGDKSSPAGNAATSILEDLGVKNPGMPKDMVRDIPYQAVKNPLPCPTGEQIDPAKLANGKIQIKPGTILTTSWSQPLGDAESDHDIKSVSPENVEFEYDGIAATDLAKNDERKHVIFQNTVCGKDIVAGEAFATGWYFDKNLVTPGLYPGLTHIFLPAARFSELKSTGSTSLVFGWYEYMDVLTEWELLAWKGKLTRVETDDVQFPLIINDERVSVPAIHIQGRMKVLETAGKFGSQDQPADAYILDDPNTPIVLSWLFGKDLHQDDAFRVQYIRVRYPDKPSIEQQLTKQRKAITYGINFDYNSDVIKPISEPVLKEIAQAMADKPDWKLTVTGHTDSIGGHAYNLKLSQRRSESVKRALVERYHMDPNRLSTGGDGDSDPVDTNNTLEGRARNRRVELTLN